MFSGKVQRTAGRRNILKLKLSKGKLVFDQKNSSPNQKITLSKRFLRRATYKLLLSLQNSWVRKKVHLRFICISGLSILKSLIPLERSRTRSKQIPCCRSGTQKVHVSAKMEKNLFFLDDPADNPRTAIAGRIGRLVVRISMDYQRSTIGCE